MRNRNRTLAMGMGILMLMLFVSCSANSQVIVDTITIDYLGEGWTSGLSGNVSLLFNYSDTGTNELVILETLYSPGPDVTYIRFGSNNITYDYTFINDTKGYYFLNVNNLSENKSYRVYVNYSSIQVPDSPWIVLEKLLEEKNATIANLTENVTLLQANASELTGFINTYAGNIGVLQTEYDSLMGTYISYKHATEDTIAEYWILVNESANKTFVISLLEDDVNDLENERDNYKGAFSDISGMFSSGYTKDGKGEFYFNGLWFFFGMILCIILIIVYSLIKGRTTSKTLLAKVRSGRGDSEDWTTPPSRKEKPVQEEILKEAFVKDSFPDVEKEFLNVDFDRGIDSDIQDVVEKRRNGVGSEQQSPVHQSSEQSRFKVTPSEVVDKTKIRKKTSWWDTPEGMKRREEQRELMKKFNEERAKEK